jgi:S1-C subfamily serine protease
VLALGATLIGTGVINTGDTRREVIREVPSRSAPLGSSTDGGGRSRSVADIYRRTAPGVVFVTARVVAQTDSPFGFPLEQEGLATGSGFVLDQDGHILTNAHVVEGAKAASIRFEEGGDLVDAKVVGRDVSTDLAVLKVDPGDTKLKPLALGNSSRVRVGDPAIAIGNPFGYDRTVTTGFISALQRQIQAPNGFSISDVIQTDAAINPGNSGGPLIDGAGQVIGINSQIESQSGGNEGVGFAVPIKTAADVVSQLESGGTVHRAYLGITGGDITPDIAHALNLPVQQGVLIERVLSGGPADDAGIKGATGQATIAGQTFPVGGDIITKVDGKPVSGMDDVISAVNQHDPGDSITMTIYSGGSQRDVTVKLGDRPSHVQDSNSSSLP